MPARDAAATIDAALASIQRQTEPSWECIVVDDGSRDATLERITAAARSDHRFTVISTPPRGLIAALNEGLAHCRAPLVARMDADDVMHRRRLAMQADALAGDATLAGVGCRVRIFPRRGMTARLREYEAWLNGVSGADDVERDAFVECPVAHPTLMMRRDIAALGYRDCGWPEDYDLILRALAARLRIGLVPCRLLAWRDRRDGASRIDPRYAIEQFTRCKAHHLAIGFLAHTASYVLWGYGDTGRMLRRALADLGKTPSHIVEVKASRIAQRIHGAPVISVGDLATVRDIPIVVSVARAGPRAEIRAALAAMGFCERRDFVCAA